MIFAETFFVRKRDAPTAPIFALGALESKRNIRVAKKDFKRVPELIRKHYSKLEDGEIFLWGTVKFYKHFYKGQCDIYTITGDFIRTTDKTRPSNGACIMLSRR